MGRTTIPERADFRRVAGAVSRHTAEVLRTGISVVDERGTVIARSCPVTVGGARPGGDGTSAAAIRLPFSLDPFIGEVLVERPPVGEEPVSPRLARALIDLVVNQVAVVDQLPARPEIRNAFIYDLLEGVARDDAAVQRQAKLFGMDLAPPRAVVLIDASAFVHGPAGARPTPTPAEVQRRSRLVVASVVGFFYLPDETICATNEDGEIAILKASDSKNLENWVDPMIDQEPGASWANLAALKRAGHALLHRLRHETGTVVNIGIGRYHPGIPGLARSYADARAALTLGRRFQGDNQVHCLDGLGIAAFVGLADRQTKLDLAAHLLSPLDHEPVLLKTLECFFAEDRCPSATAARLGIHRNTLGYRLDKIASMTGLDPRRFDDAVQIRLALVLRSLGAMPA